MISSNKNLLDNFTFYLSESILKPSESLKNYKENILITASYSKLTAMIYTCK